MPPVSPPRWTVLLALVCVGLVRCAASLRATEPPIDTFILGSASSEQEHALTASLSETITGGMEESARRLLPVGNGSFEGGSLAFTMSVDPARINYLTARFWGSDRDHDRLILFCEGRQVGYRHLGDIDMLDIANGSPACQGRFFYETIPLPEAMTRGKKSVHLEIRATGPIWGYGKTFAQYQKPMTEPGRGIYRLYTHIDGCFAPPPGEKQGVPSAEPSTRAALGPETLDALKQRVNKEIAGLLGKDSLNQEQLFFLARAYHVEWTVAHQNPKVVQIALRSIDAVFADYRRDPATAQVDKAISNGDWLGIGKAAAAVVLLAEPLQASLDAPVAGNGETSRRAGWAEMFRVCRDWHREHRRQYTNQSMISDTYGLYYPNRAVALLAPDQALPEAEARRYLCESAGLQPWLGDDKDGAPLRPLGDHYFQLTDKGLSKELGFVGYYGEVLDWMTLMYEATRPSPDAAGDEKLKAQLVKAARARAVFRYPTLDDDGCRAMRAEAVVGWRDGGHYPGDITYVQRATWDASGVDAAAAALDPVLLGGVRQMLADNQFFASVSEQMKTPGLRTTAGLLNAPDSYARILAHSADTQSLPMTPGQPDFVFADEEDGVVAVKHGGDILYASLYWRARFAVNSLAKVHFIQPGYERIAVLEEEARFTPSGMTYRRPDLINMEFAGGGVKYPGDLHSANAGEELPIAKIPDGVKFRPGDESVYAGRADFYTLRYGSYLIGMNAARDRSFDLPLPATEGDWENLTGGDAGRGGTIHQVGPRTTVVFHLRGK